MRHRSTPFYKISNFLMKISIGYICVAISFLSVFTIWFQIKETDTSNENLEVGPIENQNEAEPEKLTITKESTFTLSATGDILIHMPIIRAAAATNGEYDFSSVFQYFNSYVRKSDYAVANLETTLAGTDNGYAYNGYPNFNCPDNIVDAAKDAGFDLLLTANNHCYDTRSTGFQRTIEMIRNSGLQHLGTKTDSEEQDFLIVRKNDISLGLLCYTYENNESLSVKAPNGITMRQEDTPLINSFDYANLEHFYQEVKDNMGLMKEQGADAVVLFIHWGEEYQTKQNSKQKEMAQRLCDLGVDVIIGGHPHVVQPVELLTSNYDASKKTVCLYSMGNAVSNQRRHIMNLKTGHTEDGVLFSVSFARYSDGTVVFESVDLLPTWVNLTESSGRKRYVILPLEPEKDWQSAYNLSDSNQNNAKASYDRTMEIVGDGLDEVNTWLQQSVERIETELGVEKE